MGRNSEICWGPNRSHHFPDLLRLMAFCNDAEFSSQACGIFSVNNGLEATRIVEGTNREAG
jgi:hypothetical protein